MKNNKEIKRLHFIKKMPTQRIYICSALKGNVERNIRRAEIYCRFAFDEGFVPVAPHIYYPRFLDNTDKDETAAGQRYGLEEMWRCEQLWVFGAVNDDMRDAISLARELEIPVRHFDANMEEA